MAEPLRDLIHVSQVAHHLPPSPRTGRPLSIVTVYRWISHGVRGVKLRSIKIGGTTYVRARDLRQFSDQLTKAAVA